MRIKKPKRKTVIIPAVAAIIFCAVPALIIWENNSPVLTVCKVTDKEIPKAFSGYRIAQISDLHNAKIGKNNEKLLSILEQAEPDIIAITGDLIDSRHTDTERALSFVKEALKIAPCYFVTGNHEARISEYDDFKKALITAGVNVLENDFTSLEKDGDEIFICGVIDPRFQHGKAEEIMREQLQQFAGEAQGYTVLLSHRPELISIYAEKDIDLALTGHAHGGQFRLPLAGGLAAPNQGLFPEYDAGLYSMNKTKMFVCRGIGNSLFPFRINNRPEIAIIILNKES